MWVTVIINSSTALSSKPRSGYKLPYANKSLQCTGSFARVWTVDGQCCQVEKIGVQLSCMIVQLLDLARKQLLPPAGVNEEPIRD